MNWAAFFEEQGAVWRYVEGGPHAAHQLTAHHSGYYLNTDVLTRKSDALAACVRDGFLPRLGNVRPDVVLAPRTSIEAGWILAKALGAAVGAQAGFVDVATGRCSVDLRPGDTIVLITDDLYSGGGVSRTLEQLAQHGHSIMDPVFALANFSGRRNLGKHAIEALVDGECPRFLPADCPFCREGSSPLPARAEWLGLRGQ